MYNLQFYKSHFLRFSSGWISQLGDLICFNHLKSSTLSQKLTDLSSVDSCKVIFFFVNIQFITHNFEEKRKEITVPKSVGLISYKLENKEQIEENGNLQLLDDL